MKKTENLLFWRIVRVHINSVKYLVVFFLLLGDEVDFSAGFPARPVGSLGAPILSAWLVVLLGPPTSPLTLWVGPGWLSGWLSRSISWLMGLLDRPTQSPQCPIHLTVYDDRSQPSGRSKVSRKDTTLWS